MIRRYLRITAIVLAIASFFSCFWPDIRNRESDEERHTFLNVGLPISPWFHLEDHKIERRNGNSVTTSNGSSWNVEFVSWSLLMPVVSLGLFWVARKLRMNKAGG